MTGYCDPPKEHQFKPGQAANPGGKTSAQRKLEVENAEKATRIHGALLDQIVGIIEAGGKLELEAQVLKLVKDAQDRGLGAPKQTVDNTHDVSDRMSEGMREFQSKLARVATRSRTSGDPS
jgi:hypothetical protein